MNNKWILKINDGIYEINNFDDAIKIINDELFEQFTISQCYYERVPFSVGCLENQLYDSKEITDEQMVVFDRIRMLLNSICQIEELTPFDYIKHNYNLYYEDDYVYDFSIIKNSDELVLTLKVDCHEYIDYLETNMFNLKNGKYYYFKTTQRIVTKSKNEKYNLGDIISLDITLKMRDS